MQVYKISLNPIGNFYFGTEQTLGDSNVNYFAKSNYFPQQTTLLGMLRYRLLEMQGWLRDADGNTKADPEKQAQLIGPRGFNAKSNKRQDFGVIQDLSPVFIQQGDHFLLPGALNNGYHFSKDQHEEGKEVAWTGLQGTARSYLPVLDKFDYKKPVDSHFIHSGSSSSRKYEEVFRTSERTGITKKRAGETDKKAFFKQEVYTFSQKDYRFVFYAKLQSDVAKELAQFVASSPNVPMGGERSVFAMEMKPSSLSDEVFQHYLQHSDQDKQRAQIILLSKTLVPSSIYKDCDFAISQTADFRHITSTIHYASPTKSKGYRLLEKGSVLYPDQGKVSSVTSSLRDNKAFLQIGYNAYVLIEKGKTIPKLPNIDQEEKA